MTDYTKMRRSMVDGQLRTNGLTSAALIEQFLTVPREDFLTGELKKSAYVDDDIPLPGGGFLMEPMTLARILTAADVQPHDTVLNIGDAAGYTAAILSGVGAKVITVVSMDKAPAGSYSVIVLNGAVMTVPETLRSWLQEQGRLVAVVRPPDTQIGVITIVKCDSAGIYSLEKREEASIPYLPGQEPPIAFTF